MGSNKVYPKNKSILNWALFGVGLALFIAGLVMRVTVQNLPFNPKWLESFGILFIGWGIINLARTLPLLKNAAAARRAAIEEQDERSKSIRYQAGNTAFLFMMAVSIIALLIYSNMTADQPGFDPIWFYQAFVVVGAGIVYVASLVWFNSRN